MYISINPTIYKQINKISPKEKSVEYKNTEERKNKILIYGTLASLACLAIGGFTYKALKRSKHEISPFDYNAARGEINKVSDFIKKLPIEIQNIIISINRMLKKSWLFISIFYLIILAKTSVI